LYSKLLLACMFFIQVSWGHGENRTGACSRDLARITIDIGHTEVNPGATSARGTAEFYFNRRFGRVLAGILRDRGFVHVHIVERDGPESLDERVKDIHESRPDLVISIHHDSVQEMYLEEWEVRGKKRHYSDRFSGFSLFVSSMGEQGSASQWLGREIGASLMRSGFHPSLHHAEPIAGESRLLLERDIGLYRYDELKVLNSARAPTVLIEVGYQVRFARAIERGIRSFCGQRYQ